MAEAANNESDYSLKIVVHLKVTGGESETPFDSRGETWLDGLADEVISAIDRTDIDYDGATYEIDAQDVVDLEPSN
jgi:hypothetical protein